MFQFVRRTISDGVRKFTKGKSINPLRMYSTPTQTKKNTILDLQKKYREGKPITMVTAYDYTSAYITDQAGIDALLVGDSLGMVMMGENNTVGVTMDDMVHHCKAVTRGAQKTFIVGDMPFGSYESSSETAILSAFRLMKEGKVDAVKLEGGRRMAPRIEAIVQAGVPVMGHIGLTPQTLSALGGFRVQGKTAEDAESLLADAEALKQAGCFSLVIESVPEAVGEYITKKLDIPTIGIGAGNKTSGQILVWHDMFGLYPNMKPKFCKQYVNLGQVMTETLQKYKEEVTERSFPGKEHTYTIKPEEWERFLQRQSATMKGAQINNPMPANLIQSTNEQQARSQSNQAENTANASSFKFFINTNNNNNTVTMRTNNEINDLVTGEIPPFNSTMGQPFNYELLTKNVCLIGGGAMGSLFAARLALTRQKYSHITANTPRDVWMISSWKEHAEKINKTGLVLHELDKSQKLVTNIKVTEKPEDVLNAVGPADLCVVLVKGLHTQEAAKKAMQVLSPKGVVLTLQNGLGNREALVEELGSQMRVYQGVTNHGASILQAGEVKHGGMGLTTIALNSSSPFNLNMVEWASYLTESGFETRVTEELESMIWGKLIINAGINTLTALLQLSNGELYNSPVGRKLLEKAVQESVKVAQAKKIRLPYEDAMDKVLSVLRDTSENVSSMLYDVKRGEKTEVQCINGAIVSEGERLGIPVHFNKILLDLLSRDARPISDVQDILLREIEDSK
jgi:3-methyl-2-oxobutanoate hydroxymethyltransferase